jgi:hypothetical protein
MARASTRTPRTTKIATTVSATMRDRMPMGSAGRTAHADRPWNKPRDDAAATRAAQHSSPVMIHG